VTDEQGGAAEVTCVDNVPGLRAESQATPFVDGD